MSEKTRAGRSYGDYEILDMLGAGGMGEVYRARQRTLDRFVAVKFITSKHWSDELNRRRFLREIRACANLSHPNIIKIYDWGELEGDIYLVMEYLEGDPLEDYIARAPKGLPVDFVLKVAEDILAALAMIHPQGFIHRDIKPGNVMITRFNRAVLMDFGLVRITQDAQLTQSGRAIGTPRYMPPEVLIGQGSDHRGDLYQVGLIMCEAVLGKLPFRQRELLAYLRGKSNRPPETARQARPDLPDPLATLLGNAMELDPGNRYQDVGHMLADLAKVREGITINSTRSAGSTSFPRVFSQFKPGQVFLNRYQFLSFLTRDALEAIVTARDRERERRVRLHILCPTAVPDASERAALTPALQALRQLAHPNLQSPVEVGREGDASYLVYPFDAESTLKDSVEARANYGPDVVARTGIQLASGLQVLHEAGLVHGFISPSCILVSPVGTLLISELELGVMALETSLCAGKEVSSRMGYYSSPHQLDGGRPRPADDLYSLSVLLLRLLTGEFTDSHAPAAGPPGLPLHRLLLEAVAASLSESPPNLAWLRGRLVALHPPVPDARPLSEALIPTRPKRRRSVPPQDTSATDTERRIPRGTELAMRGLAFLVALAVATLGWALLNPMGVRISGIHTKLAGESATVSWLTNRMVPSRLRIKTAGRVPWVMEDPAHLVANTHAVQVSDLVPGTEYDVEILMSDGRSQAVPRFRTEPLAQSNRAINYEGLSARVSWDTNYPASCSVEWGGKDIDEPEQRTSKLKHQVTLAGPKLIDPTSARLHSRGPMETTSVSAPFPVMGLRGRWIMLRDSLYRLDFPGRTRRVIQYLPDAPNGEAIRHELSALGNGSSELLSELAHGIPKILDSPHVPPSIKGSYYALRLAAARLERACILKGLEPPYHLVPSSLFRSGGREQLHSMDTIDLVVIGDGALSLGREPSPPIQVELPDAKVQDLEIEVAGEGLAPAGSIGIALGDTIELELWPPPAMLEGNQDLRTPDPPVFHLYHTLDPKCLGQGRTKMTLRFHELPGAPPSLTPVTVRSLRLRYRLAP